MRGYHIRIVLQRSQQYTFIPTKIFEKLPEQKPKPTTRKNALLNQQLTDYRFGPIRIDWADLHMTSPKKDKKREPATAAFVLSSETAIGSTNLPEGVVHVFRDEPDVKGNQIITETDVITLGVLAVPSWMTPSDFLAFVAPAAEGMAHLRILRDSLPNRSMALIQFRNLEDASDFVEVYNGKPFNSMEPELCNVVQVRSISIDVEDSVSLSIARIGAAYELPTCPVCLERMDSAVTGLITVPCSHTFHCTCLSKWGDSRCPVCRYSQTLLSSHPTSSSTRSSVPIPFADTSSLSSCSSCPSTTNLWICLICGNVGCGRYGSAHAQAHYESTTHLYALELETQRVWDYAGDGYVHRLIQNRADGKLVELPSAASSLSGPREEGGSGPTPSDTLSAEKIEAIGIEYSYLLTSQLDSQRSYYEDETRKLTDRVQELTDVVEGLNREMEKVHIAEDERRLEREAHEAALEKGKQKAEARAEKAMGLARKFEKDFREEKAVNEGLMQNMAKMREKVDAFAQDKEELGKKINDLEEQLRDVMFFLDAKNKIEEDGEGSGGTVEIREKPKRRNKK